MSHLDEGVQSLAIHLQELRLNVQHVNLGSGHHYSDEDAVCGAQPLTTDNRLDLSCWRLLSTPFVCIYHADTITSVSLLFHYTHEIFTFIDLYNRSAKNAGLLFTHFTGKQITAVSTWSIALSQEEYKNTVKYYHKRDKTREVLYNEWSAPPTTAALWWDSTLAFITGLLWSIDWTGVFVF